MEDVDSETDHEQEENELNAGKTKCKRKRDNEDEDKNTLPQFVEMVERFDKSETAASIVLNLFSEKKKLSQCQINQKKKKFTIEIARKFTVKRVKAIGLNERKDITKVEDGVGKVWRKMFTRMRKEHFAVVL